MKYTFEAQKRLAFALENREGTAITAFCLFGEAEVGNELTLKGSTLNLIDGASEKDVPIEQYKDLTFVCRVNWVGESKSGKDMFIAAIQEVQ